MIPIAALFVVVIIGCLILLHISQKYNEVCRRVEKMFPGPTPLPLIGNTHLFRNSIDGYYKMISLSDAYNGILRLYIGGQAFVVLSKYKDFEPILSSNFKLEKGDMYQFLYPWIGTGLLTSWGDKWKSRRRIITPAFHFKVLDAYVELFNANGIVLCQKLEEFVGKGPVEMHEIIKLYALDNICETAMKYKSNALTNSESTYVRAIKDVARVVTLRTFSYFLFQDIFFYLTKYATVQKKALKIIHDTTKRIIKERREELAKNKLDEDVLDEDTYAKKKMVFLDILLSSTEGSSLSDEDICDEVNTFMFEGHDTVSSGITFALYSLAHNPSVQETAYQEQLDIFGDSDRLPTASDLQDMKYLDMVLKESQRMYPSVPFIGRRMHEDILISEGRIIPKGCQVTLFIAKLHRDPEVWPEPNKFNPDNFLPDAVAQRSPYAYVPFSAGARNCIGQRFAILEMKSCLSKILRKFKLLPSPFPEDEIRIFGELVLVSSNGVKLQVERRK